MDALKTIVRIALEPVGTDQVQGINDLYTMCIQVYNTLLNAGKKKKKPAAKKPQINRAENKYDDLEDDFM